MAAGNGATARRRPTIPRCRRRFCGQRRRRLFRPLGPLAKHAPPPPSPPPRRAGSAAARLSPDCRCIPCLLGPMPYRSWFRAQGKTRPAYRLESCRISSSHMMWPWVSTPPTPSPSPRSCMSPARQPVMVLAPGTTAVSVSPLPSIGRRPGINKAPGRPCPHHPKSLIGLLVAFLPSSILIPRHALVSNALGPEQRPGEGEVLHGLLYLVDLFGIQASLGGTSSP